MRIDPHVMADVSGRLSVSADRLSRAAAALSVPGFGGPEAGRAHRAQGEAVQSGLSRLSGSLSAWATASRSAADALTAGAAVFVAAEAGNRANLVHR